MATGVITGETRGKLARATVAGGEEIRRGGCGLGNSLVTGASATAATRGADASDGAAALVAGAGSGMVVLTESGRVGSAALGRTP